MNNMVILDHKGLFIYIDGGYPCSFFYVNILQHSSVYKDWCQYFNHKDEYFEYLLGDLGYMGKEMFIMCRIR